MVHSQEKLDIETTAVHHGSCHNFRTTITLSSLPEISTVSAATDQERP